MYVETMKRFLRSDTRKEKKQGEEVGKPRRSPRENLKTNGGKGRNKRHKCKKKGGGTKDTRVLRRRRRGKKKQGENEGKPKKKDVQEKT